MDTNSAQAATFEPRGPMASETAALTRLIQANSRLWHIGTLTEGLDEILAATIELLSADKGMVQLLDAERGVLTIVAQRGFPPSVLDSGPSVSGRDYAAGGRAIRARQRIVIEDTETDGDFAPLRPLARELNFRALQSTPLVGRSGETLGVISTHFRSPHRPNEQELQWVDLYMRQAADFIGRCRADEAQSEREHQLQLTLQHYPGLVSRVDRNLRYRFASSRYAEWLPIPAADVVGKTVVEVIGVEAFKRAEPYFARVLAGEMVEFENCLTFDRSKVMWVLVTFVPERTVDGTVDGFVAFSADITERKRAEQELAKSERKFRCLHESMRDAFGTVDLSGRILDVNQAFEQLLGYSAEELRTMTYHNFTPAKWHEFDAKIVQEQVIPRGFSDVYEKEFRRKDGRTVAVELRVALLRDEEGRPERLWAIVRDITERKRVEQELAKSERSFRRLYESMRDAFATADFSGRFVDFNQTYEQLLGYSAEELRTMTYRDVTPECWHEFEAKIVQEQVIPYGFSDVYEKEYRRKDGRTVPVELRAFLIRDEEGRPERWWAIVRDITERKQVEETLRQFNITLEQRVIERTGELREREEHLRAILDTATDAILTIDPNGLIISANPATERMFGYPARKLAGQHFKKLIAPMSWVEIQFFIESYLDTGDSRLFSRRREGTARRCDGSTFPIELSMSEIANDRTFTCFLRDISERKELQRYVLEAAAEEQRRIGSELHDGIQQELTGLSLFSAAISQMVDGLEKSINGVGSVPTGNSANKQTDSLKLLRETANKLTNRLADTHRHVRELARGILPVAVDSDGLREALERLAARHEPNVVCRLTISGDVAITDNTMASHVYRIAQEATTNAIRHGGANEIGVSLTAREDQFGLEVIDNGSGFDAAQVRLGQEHGMGLRTMEYRASLIGGTLHIRRLPQGGMAVLCMFPRPKE